MTSMLRVQLIGMLALGLAFTSCANNNAPTDKNTQSSFAASFDSLQRKVPASDTAIKSETAFADTTTAQQSPPKPVDTFTIDSSKKYVFLTFDDGPQPGTMNVYHHLTSLGIKGTFFMVGLHATYSKGMRSTVDTIRNGYPEVLLANHSYTHANGHYKSFYHHEKKCFADFIKAQKSLEVPKKFIRLPGNSGWVLNHSMLAHPLVKPVCNLLDSAGYNVIGWDVEWHFKNVPHQGSIPVQSPLTMVKTIEYALKHGHTHRKNAVVMLAHDRMFRSTNYSDSLYKFLKLLKQRNANYVFETVDHYPGVKKN